MLPLNNESTTTQVYSYIRDGEFGKAREILTLKYIHFQNEDATVKSRPILSLLAYCCYNSKDFIGAADFYEELVALCPNEEEYQVLYVQSLAMSGAHQDAYRQFQTLSTSVSSENLQRLRILHSATSMELGLMTACRKTLSKCDEDDPNTIIAMAQVDYNENKFANALEKFKIAKLMMGNLPMLTYYVALCQYQMGDHETALEGANELIDRANAATHDESEDDDESAVKELFLAEAVNFKAVICHEMEQSKADGEAPPSLEKEIRANWEHESSNHVDGIASHNKIMSCIELDPSRGIERLHQQLSNESFPAETLRNLLLLCIEQEDALGFEVFEANKQVAREVLPSDLFTYIQASITSFSCPDDAFEILGKLTAEMTPKLKAAKKKLDEASVTKLSSAARPSTTTLRPATTARILASTLAEAKQKMDILLKTFVPILMSQAKILWDKKEYSEAEQLLLEHSDSCASDNNWNLNLGHTLFAQGNDKLETSIQYYEHVVNQWADRGKLILAPAVALANLCVAYIMVGQNESAETILKAVENEEDQDSSLQLDDDAKPTYHACLVNLVIGTLYCEKGKYDFGISRICKSLEPFDRNLCTDVWVFTKRCFLSLATKISKLMIMVENDVLRDIIYFLNEIEIHGKHVDSGGSLVTVAEEARHLKNLFLNLRLNVYEHCS